MLTESKVTITFSVIAANAALGVSGSELLKIYYALNEESIEVENLNNELIKVTKIKRTRNKTTPKGTTSNFDLRKRHAPSIIIGSKHYTKHKGFGVRHIKNHLDKLVGWEEANKTWWEDAYKQREYVIKNQNFQPYFPIVGGYSDQQHWWTKNLHMNQFCDKGYLNRSFFQKYKEQFWLMCTIDGKNPEKNDSEEVISWATKAEFQIKDGKKKQITYLTITQAKKKGINNTKITEDAKTKFVIYDYSPEWWKWSYEYRLEADRKNETSPFPLSNKFRTIIQGWEDLNNNATALNKVCKDFYEQTSNNFQDEIDDAWRYCSDDGKQ
ncbi:hypothetical protein [Candidatus Mycoplasma haematohominis]|uniref:hypothetical protein n=1 Tax=Candidatus Mycoplasma haematohominis TaxID=1494318 RepID=UPI001C0A747C|nr:hypothetical protein [Candidatus Mycoplasma haemohominis]